MSHKATNWAWGIRGLTPAQKLVLMCLADCHNPAHGCFPTQQFIADDCEISRRSVNTHLDYLEAAGLILRLSSVDEKTFQQRPTRYHLAFEDGFEAARRMAGKPVDKGAGRVQDLHTEPCAKTGPKPGKSRVQNLHTNPVNIINRNTRARGNAAEAVNNAPAWQGDPTLRQRIVDDRRYGDTFARSYLDSARPDGSGGIVAASTTAFERLNGCAVLSGIRIKPP